MPPGSLWSNLKGRATPIVGRPIYLMNFEKLLSQSATLAPEVLLTPEGVKRDWALSFDGTKITGLGPASEFPDAVPLPGRAIIPGMVDAHTHVGQIFGKALIGGEPAQIWRRMVSACGLDEFSGDIGTGHGNYEWAQIEEVILAHIDHCASHEMIEPSVCCSSFMGNTPETLERLSQLCAEKGILLQIHSNEHFPEVHECILRHSMRPTELLYKHNILGPHVILHHTTLVSERIEHALPVADFSCGAAWTWVDSATTQGAKATGGAGVHGPLSKDMAADFLVLDMMHPECLPSHDFEWELVRYYNRDQVDALVVNGRVCMANGQPVGWDVEDLRTAGLKAAKSITSASDIKRCHGPSDLYRPKA